MADNESGDIGADDLSHQVAREVAQSLRVVRASRGLSQRGLADATGVSKSVIARWETNALPPGVAQWLRTMSELGMEVTVSPQRGEDDLVTPPPHRDAAGRQCGWGTRVPEPEWFWRRRGSGLSWRDDSDLA